MPATDKASNVTALTQFLTVKDQKYARRRSSYWSESNAALTKGLVLHPDSRAHYFGGVRFWWRTFESELGVSLLLDFDHE